VATGATMAFVPVLFTALLLVLVMPACTSLTRAGAQKVAVLLGVLSITLLVIGRATCHYGPHEPAARFLDYGLDLDSGKAVWFSHDAETDARVPAQGSTRFVDTPLPAFTRSDATLRAAPAPAISRVPARVTVSKNEGTAEGRLLELGIQASADARCWQLWQEPASGAPSIVDERINSAQVSKFVRFSPELDAKLMRAVTGDTSRIGWHMSYCGAGARSVPIALRLLGHGVLTLRLLERVDGLPLGSNGDPEQRASVMLGPTQDSCVSLITRALEL
jgi:hypothetical protein